MDVSVIILVWCALVLVVGNIIYSIVNSLASSTDR